MAETITNKKTREQYAGEKTTRKEYGDDIDKMEVGDKIKIPSDYQQRIMHFIRREYNGSRTYLTRSISDDVYLFRIL